MSKWSVRKVKTFLGNEGHGFNAELCRDGRPVAYVIDSAQGGEYEYQWYDHGAPRVDIRGINYENQVHMYKGTPEERLFVEAANVQTYVSECGERETQSKDADIVMGELVDAWESNRKFKRLSKTRTLFRLKGDEPESWRAIKAPFHQKVVAHIREKYADKLETVYDPAVGL